jgi:dTDP-4-amino-4,6-dideoxygalactose transaminase
MSIPFFSIDFDISDWKSYAGGTIGIGFEKSIDTLIKKRFPNKKLLKFASSRMGFYFFLEQNFKSGDEIIFPSMGFPLYIKMAIQLGLKPVLVDVEKNHLTINPELIKQSITKKTKAVVVTHLFGHPGYLTDILDICNKNGVELIEDCAQSLDSFHENVETGNYGSTSFFSTGAVKVPTSLGGGFMITNKTDLVEKIKLRLENKEYTKSIKRTFPYYIKNLVSILNSYPILYSILSHRILGLLKKRNPALMRKLFYSGMDKDSLFNPWERPKQINYQYGVCSSQFNRIREMTNRRRENSIILNEVLKDNKNLKYFNEEKNCFWNSQYYVLYVEKGVDKMFEDMFKEGIHLLDESVWDCSKYEFPIKQNHPLPVTKSFSSKLVRIPNSSHLTPKIMESIALKIKKVSDNLTK